jgi:hypothetical protein
MAFGDGAESRSHLIVAIGSDAVGMVTPPDFGSSHYITSKMGVVGVVRALASELATVNAVHPGITDTDTEGARGIQNAQVCIQQAIKRLGTPADIAGPLPSSPAATRTSPLAPGLCCSSEAKNSAERFGAADARANPSLRYISLFLFHFLGVRRFRPAAKCSRQRHCRDRR